MTSTSVAAPRPDLVRGIRRWDFVALIVNITIGAGILGLPAKIYALVGAYSLVAYGAAALIVTLIILCFAEVSSRFSGAGGPYLYAREAFGPLVGFEVGWLLWVSRLASFAALCNLFVDYAAYFWPAAGAGLGRGLLMAGLITALTLLNLVGVRRASAANNVFTVSKVLLLVLFTVVGLFFVDWRAFSFAVAPTYTGFSSAVLLLIFTFSGFDVAAIPAAEIQQPQRNVPFALFTAIATVAVLFLLVQVVCIGTLPDLASAERPLASATQQFLGPIGAAFVAAAAMLTALGTLNALMLTGPRLLFALAEQKQIPAFFGATHPRFRTPYVAILVSAVLKLALAISGTFIYALTLSTIIRLAYFALTCAALPVLRRRHPERPAPFRVWGGAAVAALCVGLCLWLLSNSAAHEARDVAIVAGAGLVLYVLYNQRRSPAPRQL
ncbi:APC family permease [Hymenobacter cellulosilyticus]|uniref:Arginine/agmatine antiporter n=1 Tax=Hymenobacter cellulosilyticus TaxID=2932248 RepID=A0A8T9Q174_9BACT|nr:amino acid permease [Hymenobacter cellulosilyticus]UOQ71214.1 APC family permease [Hymenobacter cellulosilyticus]